MVSTFLPISLAAQSSKSVSSACNNNNNCKNNSKKNCKKKWYVYGNDGNNREAPEGNIVQKKGEKEPHYLKIPIPRTLYSDPIVSSCKPSTENSTVRHARTNRLISFIPMDLIHSILTTSKIARCYDLSSTISLTAVLHGGYHGHHCQQYSQSTVNLRSIRLVYLCMGPPGPQGLTAISWTLKSDRSAPEHRPCHGTASSSRAEKAQKHRHNKTGERAA